MLRAVSSAVATSLRAATPASANVSHPAALPLVLRCCATGTGSRRFAAALGATSSRPHVPGAGVGTEDQSGPVASHTPWERARVTQSPLLGPTSLLQQHAARAASVSPTGAVRMAATSNAAGGGASASSGPLRGITVLEIAGLAPAPFAGLILQDFGANVIRIDRPSYANTDCLHRGKRSVAINLKKPEGVALVKELAAKADVLIEPFRPGVMEKLGLGPDVLLEVNPRLVFARMTGWGQTGSYAKTAGHDINYIALSGALSLLGRKHENPAFPINILGDFAGGGMLCAMGILLALLERGVSGRGQVVDAAMVEGASYLVSMLRNFDSSGFLPAARGENMLNSGAHFYEVYKTKDGKFVSIGAIEPHFYAQLLEGLGLADDDSLPAQMDQSQWPAMKEKFTTLFASKTRDEWCAIFEGTDACFAPVLELDEVATHPHTKERRLLVPREGNPDILEAAPAPLLSRTPGLPSGVAPRGPEPGQHSLEILAEFGVASDRVASLVATGVVADSSSKRSKL